MSRKGAAIADPDAVLMARAAAGDRDAFGEVYERLAPAVMRFAFRLCRDRDRSEDLVQETFLRALGAAGRWAPRARVSTWLLTIARRLWWKEGRREARRPRVEVRAARPEQSGEPTAADRLARAEEATRLEEALAGLAPHLRVVFVLVRLEGLPYREAAEVAGIRLGTLKSRMAAAEERLREALAEGEPRGRRGRRERTNFQEARGLNERKATLSVPDPLPGSLPSAVPGSRPGPPSDRPPAAPPRPPPPSP